VARTHPGSPLSSLSAILRRTLPYLFGEGFSPPGDLFATRVGTPAVRELEREIAFMQANTFEIVGEQYRATLDNLKSPENRA
jgi:hypothetical protein